MRIHVHNLSGYFEGATSSSLIYDLHEMFNALYPNTSALNKQITQWFETHISWIQMQISDYKQEASKNISAYDPFWETAGVLIAQLEGLVSGYNDYAAPGQVYSPPILIIHPPPHTHLLHDLLETYQTTEYIC